MNECVRLQRYKLLNFWMAPLGKSMYNDWDVHTTNKKRMFDDMMQQSSFGEFQAQLSLFTRRRIVLVPCSVPITAGFSITPSGFSKQDVVDNSCKDVFAESIVGSIVVFQTVDDTCKAPCDMYAIGVVVERAMANDQGVCAFDAPMSNGILLPVMILTVVDANPYTDSANAYGGAFAGFVDPVKLRIYVSQAQAAESALLPPELKLWVPGPAFRDNTRLLRSGAVLNVDCLEARRTLLLRALVQKYLPRDPRGAGEPSALQALQSLFDQEQAADVPCVRVFPIHGKHGKTGTDVVKRVKTAHSARHMYVWGAKC